MYTVYTVQCTVYSVHSTVYNRAKVFLIVSVDFTKEELELAQKVITKWSNYRYVLCV